MTIKKGALEQFQANNSQALLMIIGNLHRWSDNESTPKEIVNSCLAALVTLHTDMKEFEKVIAKVDALITSLGGELLPPPGRGDAE